MKCEVCQSPDVSVVAHMSGGVKWLLCAPCDRACRPDDFPVEEWRGAYETWCEMNPDEVNTYADLAPVQRWLATLTVAYRESNPELLKMGAYKLVTEYGF